MASDCNFPINIKLPLFEPYRTGSYLIFDYPSDDKKGDHFRRGDDPNLEPNTFRASGSRQLDAGQLAARLAEVAKVVQPGGRLHLVDLRQETHLFFNGRAVSWYADKDWANVGRSLEWIEADAQSQLARIAEFPTTQVFCLDPHEKEFARPTGYSNVTVPAGEAATEATVAQQMQLPVPVDYLRLTLTDHCPPNDEALNQFFYWCFMRFGPGDWVHFHCHGGDGRTTTLMCLFDMVSWYNDREHRPPFPSMEDFNKRQLLIFDYNLNPSGCDPNTEWKCALAQERWNKLSYLHDQIEKGGLKDLADAKKDTGATR